MPSLQVAGDICLRKPRPTQGCRAGDDDSDDDDDDDDDAHPVTTSRTHGYSFPPLLTFMTPCLIKEK